MKFSIIIPAYNSVEYLNKPLDSLLKQSFKDFEVIIIDDGSTDKTKEIVDNYLVNNKNWKYVYKKNGNWGSVINYVLKNKVALGDYITILDSDDWFDEDMLMQVSKRHEDVVITKIAKYENSKYKNMPVFFGDSKTIEKARAFTPISTPHGKFYKQTLFYQKEHLIENTPYQDTILYNELISKSNSIYYINKPLAIWWRDRLGNTTTAKWSYDRFNQFMDVCENILKIKPFNNEMTSWVIFYLWEVSRHYFDPADRTIKINAKNAKLKWIPFGLRTIAKMYFLLKIRKFIRK